MYLVLCFIFFFQAEDGIRDIGVTGVQTCALPISDPRRDGPGAAARGPGSRGRAARGVGGARGRRIVAPHAALPAGLEPAGVPRSEERRVGKECRYRWSATH